MRVCMYICLYLCMYVRMHVYVCLYVCMYVCMSVCMHVCVCMCLCTYVYTYVCISISVYIYTHRIMGYLPSRGTVADYFELSRLVPMLGSCQVRLLPRCTQGSPAPALASRGRCSERKRWPAAHPLWRAMSATPLRISWMTQ